jgi:hypothetical protein
MPIWSCPGFHIEKMRSWGLISADVVALGDPLSNAGAVPEMNYDAESHGAAAPKHRDIDETTRSRSIRYVAPGIRCGGGGIGKFRR